VGQLASLSATLSYGLAFVCRRKTRPTDFVAGQGATTASMVIYLTPLVGVAAGAVVFGERVTWNQPIGALAV
jgi:hypothetical protein